MGQRNGFSPPGFNNVLNGPPPETQIRPDLSKLTALQRDPAVPDYLEKGKRGSFKSLRSLYQPSEKLSHLSRRTAGVPDSCLSSSVEAPANFGALYYMPAQSNVPVESSP